MSLTDMVIMPRADYLDACNAIREKTGGTAAIKSGDMGAQIRAIASGGGVPKAVYAEMIHDENRVYLCQCTLPKSDYGYLLDCTHLLVVPAGLGAADVLGMSAFIEIATGASVVVPGDGTITGQYEFDVLLEEIDAGEIVLQANISNLHFMFPDLNYYIVGATL